MNTPNPSRFCAWCETDLSEIGTPSGLGASLKDGAEVGGEDQFMIQIEFEGQGRTVNALLPPPGSPANRHDHDLWFVLCSDACARELNDLLQQDTELIDDTDRE